MGGKESRRIPQQVNLSDQDKGPNCTKDINVQGMT